MAHELERLPAAVKKMVADGVYALYTVKNYPGVAYVLVTNTRDLVLLTR